MPENEEYNGQLQKIKNIFMPNFAHCHNARRVKAVRSCVSVLELIFLRIHEGRPLYRSDPVLRPSVLKLYHLMNGTQAKVCLFVAIFKFKVALLDRVTQTVQKTDSPTGTCAKIARPLSSGCHRQVYLIQRTQRCC